jgi:alpha-L-fucosidase 2
MIHGTVDESVLHSQSDNLKAILESLSIPCELITIPGGGHGIDKWETLDPTYKQKMVDWLRENLKAEQ